MIRLRRVRLPRCRGRAFIIENIELDSTLKCNDELARNLRHRGRRKRRRDSQYIPKGTDFSELTDEMLAEIEWKLNHRPRKSLGYRTPLEYCKQLFNFDF